jgi:vitamin K-dependent gamma-carboxylase
MTGKHRWQSWDWLFSPVDAASLACFRILFGATLCWEAYRYIANRWVREYYITPTFQFKYLFFEWVHPWPGMGMYWHFAALGLLAALIALGLFYRLAAVLFFLGFTYVFLLDQARHLNHFYLVCLVSFLICFVDGARCCSLDRVLFRRRGPETVPFWQLFLLRAQMFVVYFYAGVAKLNEDWLLRGEPVRGWLDGPLEPLRSTWVVFAIAWHAMFFDLAIGFLLISRRTRAVALVLAFAFHLGNKLVLSIGIFPYVAFALTLLFLEPDWPRALLRRLGWGAASPPEPLTQERRPWVLAFIGTYLAAQLLLPLRHWLYPGDVNWTEEGHRFSWRMKLRSKRSRITVTLRDPRTGREWPIDPLDFLTDKQLEEMEGRPDMAVQFAHHLREHFRLTTGMERPEIRIRDLCSLNRRPPRDLIDPERNLAETPRDLWSADWILRYPQL